jgi:transmembrane sensor
VIDSSVTARSQSAQDEINARARAWLLRFSLESATSQDREEFLAWCADDPRHAAAYHRFESIWQDTAALRELETLAHAPSRGWRPRLVWACGIGLAATAAFAFIAVRWLTVPVDSTIHYVTGVAEVREILLPDGSQVTLGARSSLDVAIEDNERRVALTAGQAFFSVAKNPQRPFFVRVGDKLVRVVGTKFEVRRDDASVRVAVVEGTVKVMQAPSVESPSLTTSVPRIRPPAAKAPPAEGSVAMMESPTERVLVAGQQLTASFAGKIETPQAMPRAEAAAWRRGRLVYVDATLREVIADANRYSRESIALADEKTGDLRVSVTYASGQVEQMLAGLARSMALDVERRGPNDIVLKAKATAE